jgi:bacterioferritin (cytochrome b1)
MIQKASQGSIKVPKPLLDSTVSKLLERLQDEYTAYYFYKNAANWCANESYLKAAAFFEKEANNELEHANGIQKYMTDWNVYPTLPSIKPALTFTNLIDIINNLSMKDIVKKYKISSKEQLDLVVTLICNSIDNLIKIIESNTKLTVGEIINHIIDDKIKSEAIKDSTVNEITLQISKLLNSHLCQHNSPINHNPGMTYQYRNDFIDARNEMIELFKGL